MYTCTKCGKHRSVVYNIRYGMWGANSWMCRFCAKNIWKEAGRSPAVGLRAKYRDYYNSQEFIEELDFIPQSHVDEHNRFGGAFMARMIGRAVD